MEQGGGRRGKKLYGGQLLLSVRECKNSGPVFSGSGRTSRAELVKSSRPASSVTKTASTGLLEFVLMLSATISRVESIAACRASSRLGKSTPTSSFAMVFPLRKLKK